MRAIVNLVTTEHLVRQLEITLMNVNVLQDILDPTVKTVRVLCKSLRVNTLCFPNTDGSEVILSMTVSLKR